tara:strand:- start:1519 stop:2175 length:657 start_codon:yes stop_codon:yes gene_type:complete
MNLLNNPGIQGDVENLIKNEEKKLVDNIKEPLNEKSKSNNRYGNIVILIAFILGLFFTYSLYLNSNNLFASKSKFSMMDVFSDIGDDYIYSIELINNELKIILDYDKSEKIYQDYDLYDSKYSFVRLLINDLVSQIFIKDKYTINNNVDFYELFSIISYIDEINIEKDIINDNLIVIGDYSDISNIFKALNNYKFNFKLNLIKVTSFKKYYQLTIFND